jgi:protein-disulfide isomerase
MGEDIHRLRKPASEDDWSRGPADGLPLVEYLDYQCSHCQAAYPVIESVLAELGGRVRFVVRHFPVASIHPQAKGAALAAEAAGRQGKFWEMHRRLLEARGALSEVDLRRYAQELRLDLEQFDRDRVDESLSAEIREEKLLGVRSGVNGTPTLYIGDVRYDGRISGEDLKAALLAELNGS